MNRDNNPMIPNKAVITIALICFRIIIIVVWYWKNIRQHRLNIPGRHILQISIE